MKTSLERTLETSNRIKHFVETEIATLDAEALHWKESTKKWSIIEIISHLNQVYDLYLDNFQKAMEGAPEKTDDTKKHKRSLMGRFSIYSMRPKGKKRRFKMKTFDFFEPTQRPEIDQTIQLFYTKKDQFNSLINEARMKDIGHIKMPTALGEKMKFYIPECFEFIIAHEERHVIQMKEVLEKSSQQVPA